MTPSQQRTAIAEACPELFYEHHGRLFIHPKNPRYVYGLPQEVDPLIDLSAMHEAEKVLTDEQYSRYAWLVLQGTPEREVECREFFSATATQRAEAFLRTLGKWEEAQ